MDVSGWTIDQRMRLPDWCFGNRKVTALSYYADGVDVVSWTIGTTALPAEICIWNLSIFPRTVTSSNDYIRIGLRATVPTSVAEMNTAIPLLPNFGSLSFVPPRIYFSEGGLEVWSFDIRKGMATGTLKMVMEIRSFTVRCAVLFAITYSELPTSMAGWLAHNK